MIFPLSSQKELLDTMEEQFWAVQRKNGLPVGDFPDISRFKYVCLFRLRILPVPTRKKEMQPSCYVLNSD